MGGSLSLGARGVFRSLRSLWGRKVALAPPPALHYAKKGEEEEKGSWVWCGVPRRAPVQQLL